MKFPKPENFLEVLEDRITPSVTITLPNIPNPNDPYASIPDSELSQLSFGEPEIISPSELHYLDADGDGVILKFDRDVLTPETLANAFHFEAGERGSYLSRIDVAALGDAKALKGLGISVEGVVPKNAFLRGPYVVLPPGWEALPPYIGDQKADIGFIDATGIDLGDVSIEGNLGKIVAGDSKLGTAGLESLTVESLGALSDAGPLDATALMSTVTGSLKKLSVAHDINGAILWVAGGKKADLLDAYVGGDIVGGDFDYSGSIYVDGTIKKVALGGDLIGGSDIRAGLIHAEDGIKSLTIGGEIVGGSAYGAGRVEGVGGIGAIDVRGGVHAGTDEYAGSIYSTKGIKSVTVGENLRGGDDRGSGAIFADTKIGSAVVHGDLEGGAGEGSGYLQAQKSISKLTVEGDLVGGTGLRSGSVATFDGKIGMIDHAGNTVAGAGVLSGEVINFVNKGVKKSQSSDSTSGVEDFIGETYMNPTSGIVIIDDIGGSFLSSLNGLEVYTTGGVSGGSATTTGLVTGAEGTGGFHELVMTTNAPFNADATIFSSFKGGLEWSEDVVGAKIKRG